MFSNTNPAIFDYWLKSLQPQQASQETSQEQTQAAQPTEQSGLSAMLGSHNTSNPPVNPFQNGVASAMKAAKQSIAMDEGDRRKAMGVALMHFGANLSKPGFGKGSKGMLSAITQSMIPGLEAYKAEEARATALNADIYKQLQMEQQRQREYALHMQQQKALEDHRKAELAFSREQLAETRRAHDMTNEYHRGMLGLHKDEMKAKYPGGYDENEDEIATFLRSKKLPPLKGQRVITALSADRQKMGNALSQIESFEKKIEDYAALAGNNNDPVTQKMNPAKDMIGLMGLNSNWDQQRIARDDLASSLAQFRPEIEAALKGGVPGEQLMKRFEVEKILPSLHDPIDALKQKLATLKKKLETRYKAADLSLTYGRQISGKDLDEMERLKGKAGAPSEEKKQEASGASATPSPQTNSPQEGIVRMQGPDGSVWRVPASQVKEALARGSKVL
jgi:hypothetical protein